MGKQRGVYLKGKSANILYYSWKGIPCQKMIPADVHQSPTVVAHKNANGLSTTMGASFRKSLAGVLPYPKNMSMQTALRLALLKWLKERQLSPQPHGNIISFPGELSFNEGAVLKRCLHTPIIVTTVQPNELALQIPGMVPTLAFTAPEETDHIQFKIAAACCNIVTAEALDSCIYNITIPYNSASIDTRTVSIPIKMPVNSLTIVVVALDYFTNKNGIASLISTERFRPSQVVGSIVR